ncbi:hypothetical protein ONZ45_g1503 [Pleurotus djamor]|nr:hypothetical protein ONZ45_g1503 [Pleurotus djamor]
MFKTIPILLAILLASSSIASTNNTLTNPLSPLSPSPSPTPALHTSLNTNPNIQINNKPTLSTLKEALPKLVMTVKRFENEATHFPDKNPTLVDGLAFQERFSNVNTELNYVSDLVKGLGSISAADSADIISTAENRETAFKSAMNVLATRKHALQSFPLGSGVYTTRDNLIRLDDAAMKFYDQFLFAFHNSTTCRVAIVKKEIHRILKGVIDAYATA